MVYQAMSNGRSIDELFSLVTTLQTSDSIKVASPEVWKSLDKVIAPHPATTEAAEARFNKGYECTDWYFCKKVA